MSHLGKNLKLTLDKDSQQILFKSMINYVRSYYKYINLKFYKIQERIQIQDFKEFQIKIQKVMKSMTFMVLRFLDLNAWHKKSSLVVIPLLT